MTQDERTSMLENPEWREWTLDECWAWLEEETKKAYGRYMMGREEYGPSFVGDPIEHLRNELRDSDFLRLADTQTEGNTHRGAGAG